LAEEPRGDGRGETRAKFVVFYPRMPLTVHPGDSIFTTSG
jgi:hypothetical protein